MSATDHRPGIAGWTLRAIEATWAPMFDRLWHLRGTLALRGPLTAAEILDTIADELAANEKANIHRGPNYVAFDEGRPYLTSLVDPVAVWQTFAVFDRGVLSVHPGELRYELRSFHNLVVALGGGALFFAVAAAGGGFVAGLKSGVIGFIAIHVIGAVLCGLTVRRFLVNAAGAG